MTRPTCAETFWPRVDRSVDCWEWTGYRSRNGYGQVGYYNQVVAAHRVSWIFTNGPIPKGMFVLHSCDNRGCVRPSHLFLGTHLDNMADMRAKERQARILTQAMADDIRHLYRYEDWSNGALARFYEVSPATIADIVADRTWRAPDQREQIAFEMGLA